MSRCFPFPPPGYEKKLTTDESDLLRKEKQKEKKHKKDKKDKEKRESKEKRDKDRSEGKHKEKKDRKEKHREKKDKDNGRERDKGKSSITEEKSVDVRFESCNGEKLISKEEKSGKEKSSWSDDKKAPVVLGGRNGEMPVRNSVLALDREELKFVQELGRRIKDDEKGSESNQFVDGFNGMERSNHNGVDRFAVRDSGMLGEGKHVDKRYDNRRLDAHRIMDEPSFIGKATFSNKVEGTQAYLDKKIERRIDEKDKSQERGGDEKRGDKRKNKDKDRQSQGKDRDMEKEKKEEKMKERNEHKTSDKDKSKHVNQGDPVRAANIKLSSHPMKDNIKNSDAEGSLRKRKTMESNGILHDNESRPNKIARAPSHLPVENGRKLEPYQHPSLFPSDKHGASTNNLKFDNKERKVNGMIASQPLSVPQKQASSAISKPVPGQSMPGIPRKQSEVADHVAIQPLHVSNANRNATKPSPSTPNHIAVQPLASSNVNRNATKPSSALRISSANERVVQTAQQVPVSTTNHVAVQPLPISNVNHKAVQPLPDSDANHVAVQPLPPLNANQVATKPPSAIAIQTAARPLPATDAKHVATLTFPAAKVKGSSATAEPSVKPPHPDTKYLSQILTVPKLEKWPEYDDQEWLFSRKAPSLTEQETGSEKVGNQDPPQVWAEALQLESVDICALPYVIPY